MMCEEMKVEQSFTLKIMNTKPSSFDPGNGLPCRLLAERRCMRNVSFNIGLFIKGEEMRIKNEMSRLW
jgi:hypothetical protein